MKKKLLIISTSFLTLSSCGGMTNSSKLKTSTLNHKNEFAIKVPVIVSNTSETYFKFQDGYSINDVKTFLNENNCYFEESDKYLFFNTIVENKSEYFIINYPTDNSSTYQYTSSSSMLICDNNHYGWVLIPVFFLIKKDNYIEIKNYISNEKEKELTVSIDVDYKKAKLLYSQTDQKEIVYDDTNEKFTIFNKLEMQFTDGELKYKKLF